MELWQIGKEAVLRLQDPRESRFYASSTFSPAGFGGIIACKAWVTQPVQVRGEGHC
ncbi:hypothetical protein [Tabrizicola sp.]|jgi:hypothetical protein|uniref:hypothetical protein n=1 Tax=Tabrizicola sp. TaxID=2005166 RepID=UPI0025F7B5BB|nr:hypothetical protein [Tabrizicola sp.]